jgi:hypothetical protein
MRNALCVILFSAALLAACGGGGGGGDSGSGGGGSAVGGETLYVTLTYPNDAIALYQQVVIQPQLGGFQGRSPNCSLVNGSMPAGLQVQGNCVISGRATQAGATSVTLRVGASGAGNTIDVPVTLRVAGPDVRYPIRTFLQALQIGEAVSDDPSIVNWTAASDLSISWSYRLQGGSLPTGMTLDTSTGRISGTAQASGSFSAEIAATMNTQFGTYEATVSTYAVNVNVPFIAYSGSSSSSPATAYVSQSFSASPGPVGAFLPGSSISGVTFQTALPAGLSVDGAGVVSGVATGPLLGSTTYDFQATLTNGGVSAPTQGTLFLQVSSPVLYSYGNGQVTATNGAPFTLAPTVTQASSVPLVVGATRVYAERVSDCTLAPGLTLDPSTGVVAGTPTATGTFSCFVDISTTNNGVTWNFPVQLYMTVQ